MIVLITGVISSGKSFISLLLGNCLNYNVISADKIAKDIREKDEVRREIISRLKLDDKLDLTEQLRTILKMNNKRNILNDIMHPLINKEIKEIVDNNKDLIIDCPIPKSLNIIKFVDIIVIIKARKNIIFKRMKKLNFDKKTKNVFYDIQKKEINSIKGDYYIMNNGANKIEKVVTNICNIIKSIG